MRGSVLLFAVVVTCLCAGPAAGWDINDPNAPLDGSSSVAGASAGGALGDDVTIVNDVDPVLGGDIEATSATGSGAGASSASASASGGVEAQGAAGGLTDVSGDADSARASEPGSPSAGVAAAVVVGGVAVALGIVVGGIALLRHAAKRAGGGGAASAAAGEVGATATAVPRSPSGRSLTSETHRLRIIQVDVDDDEMDV